MIRAGGSGRSAVDIVISAEFDDSNGLKNRCRFERKSWILQVLISRTLSVCGEVAERLKAAVC